MRADGPRTKAAQIAADLRERVGAGEFAPGAKLPSLRKLAADYGVTQPTAADALQQLHTDGLTGHSSGRGYFVAEVQPTRAATVDDRLEAIAAEVRELRSRVESLEASQ